MPGSTDGNRRPADTDGYLRFADWERQFTQRGEQPPIPAATVVVLRDGPAGLETLMLRKRSSLAFGGMWVFPGGRIDPGDHVVDGDLLATARTAAVREAAEEAAIEVDSGDMAHIAFWIPPMSAPKRFATWFFAARAADDRVRIDEGEITHHQWMSPHRALEGCDAGELELAAPTWVTLHSLRAYHDVGSAMTALHDRVPRSYETKMGVLPDGPVAMWAGDAGYDNEDVYATGARHRLEMAVTGFRFDDSGAV